MNCKTFILSIVITIAFCISLNAQPYYFRHYQVENGLSNNAVICSLQDKNGFLWFGTKDGLNRFDGYRFKIFRNDAETEGSIQSNFIQSLLEDENGVMWVGTESGLYRYDASSEKFIHIQGTDRPINEIVSDRNGHIWFMQNWTLFKYNPETKRLVEYPANQFSDVTSVALAPNGVLWIATANGFLKKYNAKSNTFSDFDVFQRSKPHVRRWIEKIYCTKEGTILVGTGNEGVKTFDVNTNQYKDLIIYNTDNTELFVRNFAQTAENEYWIATETGIYIYNTETSSITSLNKLYNDPYSISDNAVYTFVQDKEGGIWAGTYFGGISYYPRQYTPFKKYFPKIGENSLSGNVVREITQDNDGNLWIGTEDAGLNKLDYKTGRFTHFQPTGTKASLSYSNIHGLLVNGNELWIGTFEHGLDVMNIRTGKVIRHYSNTANPSLKSNFIYCIYKTPDNEIMLGTTTGAYKYDSIHDDFSLITTLPSQYWYTSLKKDKQGVVWATTYGDGICFVDNRTGQTKNLRHRPGDKNSLASDRVNCIFEDSQHNLWFATEAGLSLLNRKKNQFTNYTTREGLPSSFVIGILEDANKSLWISTSKGLASFDLETKHFTVYTRANGLLSDQFNFSSAFKDRTGRMYFGSAKGLISFFPNDFVKNTYIPPVYITGFQIFNNDLAVGEKSPLKKSILYTDKITLPYDQSTINIDFAALSYIAPQTLQFAYQMKGLSDNWTYLKSNRKAYFTELPPGTYEFKVKAANSSGIWNERETSLIIEILPPWWASWYAYALYILLGVAAIVYSIITYHKQIEEKNRRKIEALHIAKEKEIFEAKIEFFTNVAHEIKTPLTLIKGPLEKVIRKAESIPEIKDSLKIVERNTNRLVDLTNQLLDFRQTEIKGFSLNYVKMNIPELLDEIFTSFKPLAEQKELEYNLHLAPVTFHAFIDTDAFNKIVSNLFSNAIKYAQGKVEVRLYLSNQNDFFELELCNDGYMIPIEMNEKIFEPFFRLKGTEKQKGTGIGLALARSLAQLHNGSLQLAKPRDKMNVFSLIIPIHQQFEFEFNFDQEKKGMQPTKIKLD